MRSLVERNHGELSIQKQCKLLGLSRATYYYIPAEESIKNLEVMNMLDEIHTTYPFYGSRQLTASLRLEGMQVNRKRVQRLMRVMGITAIYPRPKTSKSNLQHKIYPYLLRNVRIEKVNHVWSTDITYVRMPRGFLYLTAVIDWFSRYVLSWELSNTMTSEFCKLALEKSLAYGTPEIFNTDQGSQFTDISFIATLKDNNIVISMDGKGRALDNVFVERLWRSVKYEEIYLKEYMNGQEAFQGLKDYFEFYNQKRPHSSLKGKTPHQVFFEAQN